MLSIILITNIIVSILHPLKYIPQCLHIIQRESADDISLQYIHGEILLNAISTTISINMLFNVHNFVYFLPIICEKSLSLGMILYIAYLKHTFQLNNTDVWNSVSSIDDYDNWSNVSSIDDDIDNN